MNPHSDRDEWIFFDLGAAEVCGFRISQPIRGPANAWQGVEVRELQIERRDSPDGSFYIVFTGTATLQK